MSNLSSRSNRRLKPSSESIPSSSNVLSRVTRSTGR